MRAVPVAFIIFNRPDLTRRVFQRIREARPEILLVIADGPRDGKPGDMDKCRESRAIIEEVDWPCRVLKRYSDINLGVKYGPSGAINWVFEQVEEAIILEDDCLPSSSFFGYCRDLLAYYRDEPKVMHIGGSNFQNGISRSTGSYYFSKYAHVWGWATWRRAWRHYDIEMKSWPDLRERGYLKKICPNPAESEFWTRILDGLHAGRDCTWDGQWQYACWSHKGIAAIPDKNLITNLGFRADGSHTRAESLLANLETGQIPALCHPPNLTVDCEADEYTFHTHWGTGYRKPQALPIRALRKLKRGLKYLLVKYGLFPPPKNKNTHGT
ncbi:MAG: hypothetical protein PHD76_04200 [Methylacidiphilales bacterium]|nr:hypothetical protein [Candidatus Methylacidiphilales bacterium]